MALPAVNQLHFIPVDLGSPIVHCAVADPYVVILSAEGQASVFVLKSDSYGGRTHRLALQKTQLHHVSAARAASRAWRGARGIAPLVVSRHPWHRVTHVIALPVVSCRVTHGIVSLVSSHHSWHHVTHVT